MLMPHNQLNSIKLSLLSSQKNLTLSSLKISDLLDSVMSSTKLFPNHWQIDLNLIF
jgi:hypothetical protein